MNANSNNKYILLFIAIVQIITIILGLTSGWMIGYSEIFSMIFLLGLVFLFYKFREYFGYGLILYSFLGLFGIVIFTPFHLTFGVRIVKIEIINLILFGVVVAVNLDKVEKILEKI